MRMRPPAVARRSSHQAGDYWWWLVGQTVSALINGHGWRAAVRPVSAAPVHTCSWLPSSDTFSPTEEMTCAPRT